MEIEFFKKNILTLKQKLFRKSLYMIRSTEEAEDIVQDLMMRMWDKRKEWPRIDNMEVYCMVMVKHMTLDRMRSSGFYTEPLDTDTERTDNEPLPPDKMEQTETKEIVWRVISRLPEKQQNIIRLREFEGLTYEKIAEQLTINEEQVKISLFRARKKIREIYEKMERYGLT